jgi:hypothetical protein
VEGNENMTTICDYAVVCKEVVAIYVKVTYLRKHEGGQKVTKCSVNAYGIAMIAGLSPG